MSERELVLKISAKNLTQSEFDTAQAALGKLGTATEKVGAQGKKAAGDVGMFDKAWGSLASQFALGSLISSAVNGLIGFGKAALDSAGKLVDLNLKTGVSLEGLQRMDFVAKQSGSTVDSYAQAVFKLGINVAKGGAETKAAVAAMGVAWGDFKAMSPEQQFNAIIANMDKLGPAGERNQRLVDLFGRGVGEAIAGLVDNYQRLSGAASISSDEQIKAVDAAGDAWEAMKSRIGTATVSMLGELSMTITELQKGTQGFKNFASALWESKGQQDAYVASLSRLNKEQNSISEQEKEQVKGLIAKGMAVDAVAALYRSNVTPAILEYAKTIKSNAGPSTEDFTKTLASAKAGLKVITGETKSQVNSMLALGISTDKISDRTGVATATIELYKEGLSKAKEESKKTAEEHKKMSDAIDRVNGSTVAVSDATRDTIIQMKEMGNTESDIALILRVTAAQVSEVTEAEALRVTQAKKHAKSVRDQEMQALDDARKNNEIYIGLAQKRGDATESLLRLEISTSERLKQQRMSGHALVIAQIDEAEKAEISSANKLQYGSEALHKRATENIKEFYQHQRDVANNTYSTIEERMAQQGVVSRAVMEAQRDAFKRDYEQMKAKGIYTYEELEAAEARWRQASAALSNEGVKKFLKGFDHVLDGASAFASGVGGKFGEVANKAIDAAKGVSSMAASFAAGDWIGGAIKALGLLGSAIGAMSNQTKKSREEFAAGMDMTLDQLYSKLKSMGAEGERLANKALNVIGKGDEEANRAWMKEVQKFFTSHEEQLKHVDDVLQKYSQNWKNLPAAMQAKEISKSIAELADEQRILTENGFTTSQAIVAQADAYNALIKRAAEAGIAIPDDLRLIGMELLRNGKLTDDNRIYMQGYGAEAIKQIKSIDDEYKKLSDSIASEAPEEIMGVVEAAARARMAELEVQRKQIDEQIEKSGDKTSDGISKLKVVAEDVHRDIARTFSREIVIPFRFVAANSPSAPGGGGEVPEYDEEGHAMAIGGVLNGPTRANIESGRREIIGDQTFMSDALMTALDRMGMSRGGGQTIVSGGGATGPTQVVIHNYIGSDKIDERIHEVGQRALQGQTWQVPQTIISDRVR